MQTGTRSAYDFGIMRSKNRFLFVLLAALALSVGLAVDALTVSDKDRLGRFIDDLIERPSDDRSAPPCAIAIRSAKNSSSSMAALDAPSTPRAHRASRTS